MVDSWIADVEEYLKIEADKMKVTEWPAYQEATESPKLRYDRTARVWYRRCSRCAYKQASTEDLGSALHKCDEVLINWPQRKVFKQW